MDYKEKATILRVCSSRKGERCSRCPAFGQGSRDCIRNAMKDGATAITDLLARAEAAEARAEKADMERDAAIQYMRKMFGWCTGCVHFTGIYGSGCKIGEMDTCCKENSKYLFLGEE